MSVETIGGSATADSTASTAATLSQTASVSQQDFLQILLTQLTYQDPLKPLDNQAFVAQLAQFTTLAQTEQLNSSMDTLLTQQAGVQSIDLLNKTVGVNSASGATSGTVTALSFDSSGNPLLTVTTSTGSVLTNVGLAQITSVQ